MTKLHTLLVTASITLLAVPVTAGPKPSKTTKAAEPAPAAPAGLTDLEQIIGADPKQPMPKVFAALTEKMLPADAEKALPGCGQLDKYGIAEFKVTGAPGIDKYACTYVKDSADGNAYKLAYARITFSKNNPDLDAYVLAFAQHKYGAAKPEQLEKKRVTWAKDGLITLSQTKGLGWTLEIEAPKPSSKKK